MAASRFSAVICHLSPVRLALVTPCKSCKGVSRYFTVKTHFDLVHPVDCRLEFFRCIDSDHLPARMMPTR